MTPHGHHLRGEHLPSVEACLQGGGQSCSVGRASPAGGQGPTPLALEANPGLSGRRTKQRSLARMDARLFLGTWQDGGTAAGLSRRRTKQRRLAGMDARLFLGTWQDGGPAAELSRHRAERGIWQEWMHSYFLVLGKNTATAQTSKPPKQSAARLHFRGQKYRLSLRGGSRMRHAKLPAVYPSCQC